MDLSSPHFVKHGIRLQFYMQFSTALKIYNLSTECIPNTERNDALKIYQLPIIIRAFDCMQVWIKHDTAFESYFQNKFIRWTLQRTRLFKYVPFINGFIKSSSRISSGECPRNVYVDRLSSYFRRFNVLLIFSFSSLFIGWMTATITFTRLKMSIEHHGNRL